MAVFQIKKEANLLPGGNDNITNGRSFSIDVSNAIEGDLIIIYGVSNSPDMWANGKFSGFERMHANNSLNRQIFYYQQVTAEIAGRSLTTVFTSNVHLNTTYLGYCIIEQAMINQKVDVEITTGNLVNSGNRSTYEVINFNHHNRFMVLCQLMSPTPTGATTADNFVPSNYSVVSSAAAINYMYGEVYENGSTSNENVPATRIAWGTNNGTYVQHYYVLTEYNKAPTVSLTSPSNNQTLYENDIFNITGTVSDTDNGNTVTVRYQINATTARAIKAFLSDGATLESFSKSLTFNGGNLYDGTALIAENLSDGVAHTLKVWATDDHGGTSAIREIPFYVVPNRAPLFSVNAPVISGLINSDKFTIDGTFDDSDGNNTIVSYRLNGASSVQVAEGVNGPFEFELSFGQLVIGANEIVIEAADSYGAKVSKTVKLNKEAVETPLLKSTARYKINPPTGSASGVLLWIQRDENLDIDVSISMTMQGEAESFVPLTVSNSAPLDQNSQIIEDEFYHEADGTKDNIILQIDMLRASLEVSDKIYLISGVLD